MLSEAEILSKHEQSLGEARRACQYLARQADPDVIIPRGPHYRALKTALEELEGCCRQMSGYREDARWIKFGVLYGGTLIAARNRFAQRQWAWFGKLIEVLDKCLASLDELRNQRTGVLASKPILPQNPSSWLQMPQPLLLPTRRRAETVH